MAQRCIRPWESTVTARVSRADPEVDYACAVQQVPDDVIAGCTAQWQQTSPLGETILSFCRLYLAVHRFRALCARVSCVSRAVKRRLLMSP